jgi:hypothetical protein
MMMLSSNIIAVLVAVSPVLSVIRLEHRTVSLIVYFIFMIALVLCFACDKMALLRIIFSLVA